MDITKAGKSIGPPARISSTLTETDLTSIRRPESPTDKFEIYAKMISENIDHYQLHLNSYQMLANKSAHCPESYSLQNTYSNLSNLYSLVKSYSPSKNSPNADYNNRLINQLKILLDNHPTLIDQDLQSAKKNNNDNYTRLKVIHDKLINLKNDLEKQVIQEHNVDSKKKAKDKSVLYFFLLNKILEEKNFRKYYC
ncbi:MAG: hypothetical protein MHPSP_000309 [Paramarteilia canceri]